MCCIVGFCDVNIFTVVVKRNRLRSRNKEKLLYVLYCFYYTITFAV